VDAIARAPALDRVTIHEGCKHLRDLHPLAGCSVRYLKLFGANSTQTLDGIGALPRLDRLHLDVNRRLKSVKALSTVRALRHFHLYGSRGVDDLGEIGMHPSLEVFDLDNGPPLPTFDIIAGMKRLRIFSINSTNLGPAAKRVAPLFTLPELRDVTFRAGPNLGFAQIEDIESLAQATKLEELYLDRMPELESLDFLAGMAALRKLYIIRTNVVRKNIEVLKTLLALKDVQFPDKLEYRYTKRRAN
jgi:hypothetical protein